MSRLRSCVGAGLFAAAAVVLTAAPAQADSGAALLLQPWEEGHSFEFDSDFYIQGRGRVRGPDREGIRINTFEGSGRYRFDAHEPNSPAVGFDVYHLNLSHGITNLPQRLTDQSVGVGFGITEWEGWRIGATVGFGFAGNLPYSDRHAWYALGNLIATRQLDERSTLQLGLNYDGNRSIFPDIPLPGVAYTHRADEDLTYTVGIPYNALHWQPLPRLSLDVDYTLLFDINATASYELIDDHLHAFGGFYNRYNGFHIADDDRHRRVFFQQRRIEAGLRFTQDNQWSIVGASGYSFSQRLERGFDVRDVDTVARFSNEPYFRLGFDLSF